MLRQFYKNMQQKEQDWHNSFSHKIDTVEDRRKSQTFTDWIDHAILRRRWHNFFEVGAGLFRSNDPGPDRLRNYAIEPGIKTVLNLRAETHQAPYQFEVEACDALGLTLLNVPMTSNRAPSSRSLLDLMGVFDTAERPILMHCKSGADRTSIGAMVWMLDQENVGTAEARKQFSIRYIHLKRSKKGVLDEVLTVYEQRLEVGEISFRDWITNEYDPALVQASFDAKRR